MIVTIDFETAYDSNYSLSKISEVDYVLSPLFETLMCSIKLGDAATQVHVGHEAVQHAFAQIDWDNVAVLAHNMRFDGAILAWHFGITPRLYLDTLSMARAMTHPYAGSSSLAKVAEHLGLPAKGTEVVAARGKWLANFTQAELKAYADYCAHDTDLCRAIFDQFMARKFPSGELALIDLALRMFIDPQVKLNPVKLAMYLHQVRAETAALFDEFSTVDKSVFSSNQQFAALLEAQGVRVPVKVSPTTGELTYALAKNDWAFKELCSDPTQPLGVQALLATRLRVKSTIEETRSATLLALAQKEWPAVSAGTGGCTRGANSAPSSRGNAWMPVPYRYYGAHTGRFSGDGGVNFANLTRGSPIRDAIEAPAGYRIVHRDASQIEARMVAWLAGCDTLTAAFREGRDVYSEFASRFYRRPITKDNTPERFTGKTAILSLGYGAGHVRFRHALFIGQGGVSVKLSLAEALDLVGFYRETYREIPHLWWRAAAMLETMIAGNEGRNQTVEPVPVIKYGLEVIWLPNGLSIQYPQLRWRSNPVTGEPEIAYDAPYAGAKKLYGAKLIENICQALARIVVTDTALRVYHQTGFRPFMGTYDSWDYLIPEDEVRGFDEVLSHEFTLPPSWASTLPLMSEGGWGRTLLEAERGVNQ